MVLESPADAEATRTGSLLEARTASPRTDVQVRNYDDRPYTLELAARDDDGVAFERRYWLDAGQFRAERAALPPGTYEVTATVTIGKRDVATCRVGDDPAETVCVEVGNHAVTVSEGVY